MKNKRCFVDTSAFLALNNPRDQHYQEAIEIAKKLDHYQFYLSDAVITETYSLLRYRLGYHVAHQFLIHVLKDEQFTIVDVTSEIRNGTLSLLEKFNDHKISYCDALSVAAMKLNKIDYIFSFDYHFEMMGMHCFS